MKRIKSITVILPVVILTAQLVSCDPGPQFREQSALPPQRRQPQLRRGFPPPPPPSPPHQRAGQFFDGPPASLSQSFNQQPQHGEPQQALRQFTLGQLPLDPRPEFDNPDFSGPNLQEFEESEGDFEGGFIPILSEEEEHQQRQRDEEEHLQRQRDEEHQQRQRDKESKAEDRISLGPILDPTTAPPAREFDHSKRFEEQETQDIEFLSAPPPTLQRRIPARPRNPAHPNQIPVYDRPQGQTAPVGNRQYIPNYSQQQGGGGGGNAEEEEEEEEEEEGPDRLSVLLLSSKFSCVDKNNGYYADEDVDCEVFHYCQDRVKHSWLCPEGASFHQVHLICMPRSEDNICERSSTFHFVNDFLYKELDGPNKTYADRYYPEGFADGGVSRASVKPETIQGAGDGSSSGYQPTQNSGSNKKRRPAATFQEPPSYQPSADVFGNSQSSGQSFFPAYDDTERTQVDDYPFQEQQSPEFQSQPDFTAFHAPEDVRVQRPRSRPQQQGRRPGNFIRHPAHIG